MATTGGEGAGTENDFTIKVGADLNEAEMRAVLAELEKSFAQVGEKIIAQMSAEFAKFAKTAGKHIDDVSPHIRKAAKSLIDMGEDGEEAFKGIEKQIQQLFRVLDRFGRSVQENVGVLATTREGNRRQSVEQTARSQDVARQQIEDTRSVSRAHSVETQRITTAERSAALERIQISKNEGREQAIAAQRAAKVRVLAVQSALQTIGRLEKGLGVTLVGIARTASTAFSKIFAGRNGGIAGAVAKQNTELNGELRRTNSIVETNTHQINNSFTEGTNTALNRRESLIRNSFRDQETIIRQSAVRQAAVFEGLRKQTQTGVVGAANRGLNIGAFLGGAAIFTAARSTFKVGSEFVRGLAVLQAQLDLTADEMKTVEKLTIDLGNDLTLPGVSALDAAEAVQLLAKQFAALGDGAIQAAEDAAKGTLQLSRAAGVGAEEAAGVVGAAVNVFGIAADQATDVADQVTAALKNAAGVGFGDFADAFKQAGAVFAQFQVPAVGATDALLEFDTALAVIARSGVVGSDAGTSLKQFFLQATRQAPATQKALTEVTQRAGESGSAFFDAAGKARPFEKTLDILRKGLKGYSDEQRTTALSTIFGSDAIRVANALLGTSTEEYAKVTDALREQGLAAKIAAAQNTGFAGALDALKSTIETAQILLFKKLDPILKTVTLGFAVLFTNILQGKGVWDIVRRGLLGIAAGLGAVLALKGAIELFQLLGTTLGFLLTPMGAFLAAAAAIGAAISILADKSPEFRKALGGIRDTLVDLGKKAAGLAGKALKNLGDIIVRDVLPFLEAVGRVIGTKVIAAFKFLSAFVVDTVIPALKTMAEFVERNAKKGWGILVRFFEERVIPIFKRIVEFVETAILPKLKKLAGFVAGELVDAFKTLVDFLTGSVYPAIFGIALSFGPAGIAIGAAAAAIVFFWDTIRPILQPAIDGFKTLGEALSNAFKLNDISGVGAGFSAVGSGIAKVAATIGGLIVDVLQAAGHAIVSKLKDIFSLPNLIAAGKGFLDFVEFIGNTLGKIVTNPKFIAVVAGIGLALVASAGLIAARFLEGFAKAFLDNLPGLVKLIVIGILGAIVVAFVGVWKNPTLVATIVIGLLAIFKSASLLSGITDAGKKAGGGFVKGLTSSIKSSFRGGKDFLSGFFGGPSTSAVVFKDLNKAMNQEITSLQAKLRVLGSSFKVDPRNLGDARKELGRLSEGLTDARLKGFLLRDSFKQIATGIGNTFKGAGNAIRTGVAAVLKGIGSGVVAANTTSGSGDTAAAGFIRGFKERFNGDGGRQISAGFRQIMDGLRQAALANGTSIGVLFVKGIGAGLVGLASAIGGFQAGKADGQSGGSGILPAILGGVTVGALVGGGAPGAAIGGVTAAASLLGAAFGRAQAKSKALREELSQLTSVFKDDLVTAIEDGSIKLDEFADKRVDFSTILGAGNNFDDATKALADKLTASQRKALTDALGEGSVRQVVSLLQQANGDVDEFNRRFTAAFVDSTAASKKFRDTFGEQAVGVKKAIDSILAPGGLDQLPAVLSDEALFKLSPDPKVRQAIRLNSALIRSIIDTGNAVTTEGQNFVTAADDLAIYALATAKLPGKTNLIVGSAADAITAANNAIETSQELVANASGHLTDLQKTSVATFKIMVELGTPIDEAIARLAQMHLPPIPESIVKDWETQLGKVTTAAEKAKEAVEAIPDQIRAIAGRAVADPAQLLQDSAVIQAKSDTSAVTDAFTNSVNRDFDNPEVRSALNQLGVNAATAIAEGITSGDIKNNTDLLTFMKPIIDAALAGATSDEEKQKIGETFTALFAGIADVLPEDVGAVTAEKFRKQVADYMTAHPFTTEVTAKFITRLENDQSPLSEGDFRKFGSKIPKGKSVFDGLLPTPAETAATGAKLNTSLGAVSLNGVRGFAAGFHSQEALRLVKAGVKVMTDASIANANTNLKISSPSKVMEETGLFFAHGLAIGIESGADAAAKASAAAAQAAVDAANDVVNKNPVNGPRTSFANDGPSESAQTSAGRNVDNLMEVLVEIVGRSRTFNQELPNDVLAETLDRWFNALLTPDLGAILKQGIDDGSIRTQADADVAVGHTKDDLLGRFNSEDRALAIWPAIEDTIVSNFDAITASAQAAIDDHNKLVMANTERILGHGLPAPTTPLSQTEILDSQTRTDQAFRDSRRLAGHGIFNGDDGKTFNGNLSAIISIAQALQTTAAQMNQRGPDVTNVAITETKDPRSTARATISELRAERLLQHGIR